MFQKIIVSLSTYISSLGEGNGHLRRSGKERLVLGNRAILLLDARGALSAAGEGKILIGL
jgi:hypothetical protein